MSKSRTVGVIYCCLGKLNRGENQKREVRRKKVTGLQNGLYVVIGKMGEEEKGNGAAERPVRGHR